MHACICLITLKHCHIVAMDMALLARLYVVNIADIRSAFIETLVSQRFCQNAVNGVP